MKDANGYWTRNGEYVDVVKKESARFGLPDTPEEIVSVDANHSTMVKFGSRSDNAYQDTLKRILELESISELTVGSRFKKRAQSPSNHFDVPFDMTELLAVRRFFGRSQELEQMQHLLPSLEPVRRKVTVLCGLGGIGKTQLAIEFARLYKDQFTAILWLDRRERETLIQSLAAVAKRLAGTHLPNHPLEDTVDIQEVKRRADEVLKWLALKGNDRWLLIFDNVDKEVTNDGGNNGAYMVDSFFPVADHGSIIITTRLHLLQDLGDPILLGKMDDDNAFELLAESSGWNMMQGDNEFSSGKTSCRVAALCRIACQHHLLTSTRCTRTWYKIRGSSACHCLSRFLY